ncbi:MAG: hypothetical protein K1X78_02475 [Verrucomicrobiaceae bacterium]|nr:hypothetical protein [Verrucomicrobiaceae bacterium]
MILRLLLATLAFTASAMAQSIRFTVSETAGLRRFGYPVTASLECASGTLASIEEIRLTDTAGKEMPAQFTAMSKWPDGSVRGLDVDFSPSPAPHETLTYRVEIGKKPAQPLRAGLSVTETADEIVVASAAIRHRIRRDGKPLLASVAFGGKEFVGPDGIRTMLKPGAVEIVKRGPFNVTLKLGQVWLEYVNTKSWVKITQQAGSERELTVDAHFDLTKLPLLWDFGAGSWLYGNLGKDGQTVTMQHRNLAWEVRTGADSVFALAQGFDGCGHFTDAEHVAAFGIGKPANDIGLKLTSEGRMHITARRRELAVYFHLVGQPIPVTAVTSPQAMIAPLRVEVSAP